MGIVINKSVRSYFSLSKDDEINKPHHISSTTFQNRVDVNILLSELLGYK